MLLTIDCGNTNTVIGLFKDGEKLMQWRMATDANRTAEDHAYWLYHHMGKAGFGDAAISGVVISTVVPSCLRAYQGLAKDHLKADCFVIDPQKMITALLSASQNRNKPGLIVLPIQQGQAFILCRLW